MILSLCFSFLLNSDVAVENDTLRIHMPYIIHQMQTLKLVIMQIHFFFLMLHNHMSIYIYFFFHEPIFFFFYIFMLICTDFYDNVYKINLQIIRNEIICLAICTFHYNVPNTYTLVLLSFKIEKVRDFFKKQIRRLFFFLVINFRTFQITLLKKDKFN